MEIDKSRNLDLLLKILHQEPKTGYLANNLREK